MSAKIFFLFLFCVKIYIPRRNILESSKIQGIFGADVKQELWKLEYVCASVIERDEKRGRKIAYSFRRA